MELLSLLTIFIALFFVLTKEALAGHQGMDSYPAGFRSAAAARERTQLGDSRNMGRVLGARAIRSTAATRTSQRRAYSERSDPSQRFSPGRVPEQRSVGLEREVGHSCSSLATRFPMQRGRLANPPSPGGAGSTRWPADDARSHASYSLIRLVDEEGQPTDAQLSDRGTTRRVLPCRGGVHRGGGANCGFGPPRYHR
jgi:hypothetical protein